MVCQQLRHMPGSKNINATTRRISKTSTHSAEEMGHGWQTKHKINVPFAFDRKEAKKHGEGGNIIGAQFKGKVSRYIDQTLDKPHQEYRETYDY
ncbi:hypothetical protein E3Q16_01645 [Wallemia mellicola]|nr:hypothetical protein E3Q16_01645 [Wallemia mellicola]